MGTSPFDVTEAGIRDLAGSVPEWVEDNYDPFVGCFDRLQDRHRSRCGREWREGWTGRCDASGARVGVVAAPSRLDEFAADFIEVGIAAQRRAQTQREERVDHPAADRIVSGVVLRILVQQAAQVGAVRVGVGHHLVERAALTQRQVEQVERNPARADPLGHRAGPVASGRGPIDPAAVRESIQHLVHLRRVAAYEQVDDPGGQRRLLERLDPGGHLLVGLVLLDQRVDRVGVLAQLLDQERPPPLVGLDLARLAVTARQEGEHLGDVFGPDLGFEFDQYAAGFPQAVMFCSQLVPNCGSLPFGSEVRGWRRHEVSQLQMTFTKAFPSVLGSEQGLAGVGVLSLMEDREGSLWVGTASGGLHRLRDAPFSDDPVKGVAPGITASPALNSTSAV